MTRARRARVNQNATRPFARRDASSVSLRTLAFTPDTDECSWFNMANRGRSDDHTRLHVFTPSASSRVLSRSPALALLASHHHHPHPSLVLLHVPSILRIRPSPSSQPLLPIPLTLDASFLHTTLSTRFTYPRRVLPALDAFHPPLTRLIRPRRVFLVLDASSSSSARPLWPTPVTTCRWLVDTLLAPERLPPSRRAHRTRDGPQCDISAPLWRVPSRYVFSLNYVRPWSSSMSMLYHARISEVG